MFGISLRRRGCSMGALRTNLSKRAPQPCAATGDANAVFRRVPLHGEQAFLLLNAEQDKTTPLYGETFVIHRGDEPASGSSTALARASPDSAMLAQAVLATRAPSPASDVILYVRPTDLEYYTIECEVDAVEPPRTLSLVSREPQPGLMVWQSPDVVDITLQPPSDDDAAPAEPDALDTTATSSQLASPAGSSAALSSGLASISGQQAASAAAAAQLGRVYETHSTSRRRVARVRFTCNRCDAVNIKPVNPVAFKEGTVFARCAGCNTTHLLVDNLDLIHDLKGPVFRAKSPTQLRHLKVPESLPLPLPFYWQRTDGM